MSAFDVTAGVAYFSMEIALEPQIPTYSGGLGVLAGDVLRAAADMEVPMVAVTLVHRRGYIRQRLDAAGNQIESPTPWDPEAVLQPAPAQITLTLEGRPVAVRGWEYHLRGYTGHVVTVYLLDTALPENSPEHQAITDALYGGNERYRLLQEAVLGLGGVALLRAVGHTNVHRFHMNEGHSALLSVALLREAAAQRGGPATVTAHDLTEVRRQCVFTTHTPVAAGHDRFVLPLAASVLPPRDIELLRQADCCLDGALDMTYLGLTVSGYVNGVSMRHGEISRGLYPGYPINSVSNGVHAATWASEPFACLYDHRLPEWRRDNQYLRYAFELPLPEVRTAHTEAKELLLERVRQATGRSLGPEVFTIGFARRATAYKRHDMFFHDLDRVRRIAAQVGPFQVLFSGKAHPADEGGKQAIRDVFAAAAALNDTVPVVYLEDYDTKLAGALVSGVDLWLNTPQKPMEASGTSGMKAAMNGVPSLSVLDGWWLEGHVEGVTGWAMGGRAPASDEAGELADLYRKLESVILPMFYGRPADYSGVMRSTIAINGSFFNAQRMLSQYLINAYNQVVP